MKLRGLLLSIVLIIFPFLVGILTNKLMKKNTKSLLSNWVNGFIVCLGIFQVFVMPCVLLKISLTALTIIYISIVLIISVISIKLNLKNIKEIIICIWENTKHTPWQTYLALALILFQMGMYFMDVHIDHDDAFYVATSVVSVGTDTVFQYDPYTGEEYTAYPMRYVLSPFPIFTAVLSQLSGVHAAILSHTVLPVIYLGLAYAVYALLGYELFKGKRKETAIFIVWLAMIAMFLNTTIYTQSSFLLYRIWQGKAFLAAVLIPYIFLLGYRSIVNKGIGRECFMLLMTMLSCCLVSSMGIMLGAIMTGIMGIVMFSFRKNVKELLQYAHCCIPNVFFAIIYLMFR